MPHSSFIAQLTRNTVPPTAPLCLPTSSSPNAYPFDSYAQVQRLDNGLTSNELDRVEHSIKDDTQQQAMQADVRHILANI